VFGPQKKLEPGNGRGERRVNHEKEIAQGESRTGTGGEKED